MGNSSLRVVETPTFKEEAQQLLDSVGATLIRGLIWALTQNPFWGQDVKNSNRKVWVLYHGGYAYLAYYSISDKEIILESIVRRETPIAPGPLGIEP